jgi:hypothetical protein
VVLAICGEAMRDYLERHHESSEAPLQALLAVNVRNAGAHALVGNRIAVSQIALHTGTQYPVERLHAICATHPQLHDIATEELTSFRLRSLYENLPSPLMAWLGRTANRKNSFHRGIAAAGNCGVAQMQGEERTLYLMGARLLGFTGIQPLYSGCGLMFTATPYGDRIGLTFVSDRSMMPNPEVMRRCLDQAVAGIAAWAQAQTPASAPRVRKRAKVALAG